MTDSIAPLPPLSPPISPKAVISAKIEEELVTRLLEKALTRLEDLLDAEDDSLVQKTATYLVDLAKEFAGVKKSSGSPTSPSVNVAIFNPAYLTRMAGEARKVLDGDVIEVEVEEG